MDTRLHSPEDREKNLPHIGFDLFPPKGAGPGAVSVEPASHAPQPRPPLPGPRKPPPQPVTYDRNAPLPFWRLNLPWLAPLALLVLGWAMLFLLLIGRIGIVDTVATQPGLLMLLAFRALPGLVICFLGMKLIGSDIGPPLQFFLQVVGAVSFSFATGQLIPWLGPFLLEPLLLLILFKWLLEVRPLEALMMAGLTWGTNWMLMIFVLARLLALLAAQGE